LHDQTFTILEFTPALSYGWTDTISTELRMPVRVTGVDITFRRLNGTAFEPDYVNIHHRDESLTGLADPQLMLHASKLFSGIWVQGTLGAGIPIGSTEQDPFEAARDGEEHQHIQFGSGVFAPILGATAGLKLAAWRFWLQSTAHLFVYENSKGYQPGNRFTGALGAETPELINDLQLMLSAEFLHEEPERWQGLIEEEGSRGRTDLLVGVTVAYDLGSVNLGIGVKRPLYTKLRTGSSDEEPVEFSYPGVVVATVRWSLETKGESQ